MLFLAPLLLPVHATPMAPDPDRLSTSLRQAHAAWHDAPLELARWRQIRPTWRGDRGLSVVIESEWPESLAEELSLQGYEVELVTSMGVQAWVPYADLVAVAELADATWVREPFLASPKGDLRGGAKVETEGVTEIDVQTWHDAGLAGQGVKVAILDVGFAAYEDFLGVELPKSVSTEIIDSGGFSSSHGTAVAEIVFDMAPKADLLLYQFRTDQEFLAAIEDLEGRNIDVVNASIGFDNIWHADGTSEYSRAVRRLIEQGSVWVGAAGNENDKYAIGPLTDDDSDGVIEIGGLEGVHVFAYQGLVNVSFRWSEGMTAATRNLDLIAYNDDMTVCGESRDIQVGQGSKPYEKIEASCTTDWPLVRVEATGSPTLTGLVGYLYGADGIEEKAWSWKNNLTLPGDVEEAIIVGACYPAEDAAPYYSSRGPTDDGRVKPDVCGPTDVSTASYGSGAFQGTSAASPHVAGLATLVVGALGDASPEEVADTIYSRTKDLGAEGKDITFGFGAVEAGTPPWTKCGCGLDQLDAAWLLLPPMFWARRRRSNPWVADDERNG